MVSHIKAWEDEYRKTTWKGHYSLELLDPVEGRGRLLDAGCGSGRYSLPLAMRGFDVVGVDVSMKALNMLKQSIVLRKLDMSIFAADVSRLPFSGNSFDFIWCYGVLQHLLQSEREITVREFHRVLKKEGILFVEVFGKEDFRYGGQEVEPHTFSRENGVIYHYFDGPELENLLGDFKAAIGESHKKKMFKGKSYMRHMISATARKP